jgi:hypothetical protein
MIHVAGVSKMVEVGGPFEVEGQKAVARNMPAIVVPELSRHAAFADPQRWHDFCWHLVRGESNEV